jgi:hypothetical protein
MRSYFFAFSLLSCAAYADVDLLQHYELAPSFILTNEPPAAPALEPFPSPFVLKNDEPPSEVEKIPSPSPRLRPRFSPNHRMHVGVRHNEARGIGYKDGYTTLEAFGIYDGCGVCFMPFVDLRAHVFNSGKWAGNVGIGERTFVSCLCSTFGSYLYYDVREVGHHLTVNQLSPGFELVGKCMEYRINGYFPLGKQKSSKYGYAFDEFEDHNIILKYKQQRALTGGDAEVGVHLTENTRYDLYTGIGPYYLHAPGAHSWGGKVRLLGRFKEYVSLEASYSYDQLFHSVVQGSISLSMPFGCKIQRARTDKCSPMTSCLVLARAAFAPSRLEIPAVKRVRKNERAINPDTDDPWFVWFVNNTSSSDGTFESPFPTLVQAQNASSPNEMIYVFRGDGTTTGMNAGITLKDGQVFFGSGIKQSFATEQGTIKIPAFTAGNPSIAHTVVTSTVVALGNNNVVSGFNITAPAQGAGVESLSKNSATIANNTIVASTLGAGIAIANGFGDFNIYNNQVSGPTSSGVIGILVEGAVNASITHNAVSGCLIGIEGGVDSSSLAPLPALTGHYLIEGNAVTGYGQVGIVCVLAKQTTANIIGNAVLGNDSGGKAGILVIDDSVTNTGSARIDRNAVHITAGTVGGPIPVGGIVAAAINAGAVSRMKAAISNNAVQIDLGAGFSGINIESDNGNSICLSLDSNAVATAAGATAFQFTASTGTINIDSISGNVGGPVVTTGTGVNFVAPGTCGN